MASEAPPVNMRAWTFSSKGDPDRVLSLSSTHPVPPSPTGSDLLIRVSHTSISIAGVNLMRDIPSFLRNNAIPELDFAGHVISVGPSAPSKFTPQTPVFGTVSAGASILHGVGTLCEYILLSSNTVEVKPPNISFEEASGLGCLLQTAIKMVKKAAITENSVVLVHGASGGIGIMATQVAKAAGAKVVATCSRQNFDMVKEAGADEVLDHTAVGELHSYLKAHYREHSFDSILDAVGSQKLYTNSPAYLNSQGIYVNVGTLEDKSQLHTITRWLTNSLLPSFLGGTPRKFSMFGAAISKEGVEEIARLVRDGKLKVFINARFEMEDVLAAYEHFRKRDTRGKVIINIRQSNL